jgi:hypothetical protein
VPVKSKKDAPVSLAQVSTTALDEEKAKKNLQSLIET